MKRHAMAVAVVALAALFFAALWNLVRVRLASGDVYPPYSSYRADPLGTKALLESLASMPGMEVGRNVRPPRFLPERGSATLCVFGLDADEWTSDVAELASLERFVRGGGRLLICLAANTLSTSTSGSAQRTNRVTGSPLARRSLPKGMPVKGESLVDLGQRWGFQLKDEPIPGDLELNQGVVVTPASASATSRTRRWHSSGIFVGVGSAWSSYLSRGSNAVIMARRLGAGSLVVSTDTFPFSNQALKQNPDSELLAWALGAPPICLFNETHLGVSESTGLSSLARRYRLQLFFAAVIFWAGLFIWKNASSFLPAAMENRTASSWVEGRDSGSGFVSLLRRHVTSADLFQRCWAQWQKSDSGGRRVSTGRIASVQARIDSNPATVPDDDQVLLLVRESARILSPSQSSSKLPSHPA